MNDWSKLCLLLVWCLFLTWSTPDSLTLKMVMCSSELHGVQKPHASLLCEPHIRLAYRTTHMLMSYEYPLIFLSRMGHSNVLADTALPRTSAAMETETVGTWATRCTAHRGSPVAAIVLKADLNAAIICVWTREISVTVRMTAAITPMRAPVSVVSLLCFYI
jgi:hypothetical protein